MQKIFDFLDRWKWWGMAGFWIGCILTAGIMEKCSTPAHAQEGSSTCYMILGDRNGLICTGREYLVGNGWVNLKNCKNPTAMFTLNIQTLYHVVNYYEVPCD